VLLSVGSALVHLVNMVLLSNLPGEKSKASGLYQLCSMLGSASGALAGGLLSQALGIAWLFTAWILVLLVAALPIWLIGRSAPRGLPQSIRPNPARTAQGETHGS
jgi:predicted MFS family arabinose efflux permease